MPVNLTPGPLILLTAYQKQDEDKKKKKKEILTRGQQEPTLIFACWPLARKETNTLFRPRTRTPILLFRHRKMGCREVGMGPDVLQHQRHILAPSSSKHRPPDLFMFSL